MIIIIETNKYDNTKYHGHIHFCVCLFTYAFLIHRMKIIDGFSTAVCVLPLTSKSVPPLSLSISIVVFFFVSTIILMIWWYNFFSVCFFYVFEVLQFFVVFVVVVWGLIHACIPYIICISCVHKLLLLLLLYGAYRCWWSWSSRL